MESVGQTSLTHTHTHTPHAAIIISRPERFCVVVVVAVPTTGGDAYNIIHVAYPLIYC